MQVLPRLTLTQQFMLLMSAISLGFVAIVAASFWVLFEIRVNGPLFNKISQERQLEADILPIPGQMLEVFLQTNRLRMAETRSQRSQIRSRIIGLHIGYNERMAALLEKPLHPDIRQLLETDIQHSAEAFFKAIDDQVLPAAREEDKSFLNQALDQLEPLFQDNQNAIRKATELLNARNEAFKQEADSIIQRSIMLLAIFSSLVIAAAMLMALWMSRSMLRHIGGDPQEVARIVDAVAAGDLSHAQDLSGKTGLLRSALQMADNLRNILSSLHASATHLSSTSFNLTDSTGQMTHKVDHQNDAVLTMQQATVTLNQSIQNIASNSSQAQRITADTQSAVEEGSRIVNSTVQEMIAIAQAIEHASHDIEQLSDKSRSINQVVGTIRDIADQTNLLALNAAIEAARAGETGRGFAVVADEVRKLAERTSQATREIQIFSDEISGVVDHATRRMGEVVKDAGSCAENARHANDSILQVEGAFRSVAEQVSKISLALSEQSQMSQHLERDISLVATVSNELQATSSLITETAQQFSALAGNAIQVVSSFELGNAPGNALQL